MVATAFYDNAGVHCTMEDLAGKSVTHCLSSLMRFSAIFRVGKPINPCTKNQNYFELPLYVFPQCKCILKLRPKHIAKKLPPLTLGPCTVTSGLPAALMERYMPGSPPRFSHDFLVMKMCSRLDRVFSAVYSPHSLWVPSGLVNSILLTFYSCCPPLLAR